MKPKKGENRRYWLCDTGCPFDLTDSGRIPVELVGGKEFAQHPVTMDTANGDVQATEVVPMQLGLLDENIEPFTLPSTPDVLSIGRR